ncbi:hypothetical protein BX070DRAFT_226814 [Coemansia spiralis]|nr:hypothetical protein BX070DRAFT_226814 [Coemansia spiralis]
MQHQHITFNVRDVGGIWSRIEKEFTSRLPLRNLIWKGGITQTPRFVEQLNVKVTMEGEDSNSGDNEINSSKNSSSSNGKEIVSVATPNLSTSPLLNICLLETADTDALDTYKAVIRPRVKNWLSKVSQRKGEEWVIIYLPSTAEVQRMATTSKFLNMRASVFDKLKSDFQTKKDIEHVVMLRSDAIESWNAVFLVIRERVVQALEDRVAGMAEEIRRLDANRLMPGWNYCKFFIVKEGLVNMYRLMGLRSEALAQYDELEAVFSQLLDSHRLSWFSKFGGGQPGDDFTDLLDEKRKPYHKQMAENSITMFDFRIYLLGRQCQLLIDLEDYTELVNRAQHFISTFSKAMREPGTGLSLSFVTSWTYSICQNVVEICEGINVTQSPMDRNHARTSNTVATTKMLAASKAEFLTSARQQLDILGTLYSRLPSKYLRRSNTYMQLPSPLVQTPTEASRSGNSSESDDEDTQAQTVPTRYKEFADDISAITNPVLTEALTSYERFDQIYVRTCEQATQYYLDCGRRRFAQVLQGDIAQLYICRERWQDAARILQPLIPSTDAASLGIMDIHLIERMAICEQHMGNVEKCLGYVLRLIANSQYLDSESRDLYADMLLELSGTLNNVVRVSSPSLLFTVAAVEVVDHKDTLCIAATVTSAIPKIVESAKIEAILIAGSGSSGNQMEVIFDANNVILEPGSNVVHLTTDSISCPGKFVVRSVTVHISNLALPIIVSNPNSRKFVRLNEHPTSPLFAIKVGAVIDPNNPSILRMSIESQKEPIDPGARVWLFDDKGKLLLNSYCNQINMDSGASIQKDGALLVAGAIEANTAVGLDIVLSEKYATMRVTLYAELHIHGQPRMVVDNQIVDFSSPLIISGRVKTSESKHIVVLHAQCCNVSPIWLESLLITSDLESSENDSGYNSFSWEQRAKHRGFLQLGECTTIVREYLTDSVSEDTINIEVEASFVTVVDMVNKMVRQNLEQLVTKHGVLQHKRYIERLVMAHIRSTIDEAATVQNMRLICEPVATLWTTAGADGTAALQTAMRHLFQELSESLVGGKLMRIGNKSNSDGYEVRHVVRGGLALGVTRKYAAVSISLDNGRFCHVYEAVPLTVKVGMVAVGGAVKGYLMDRRLLVSLVPKEPDEWLIAGPVSQEIALHKDRKEEILNFTLVPLEVGYLQLPEVICHEEIISDEDRLSGMQNSRRNNSNNNTDYTADKNVVEKADSKYQRIETLSTSAQTTACVLASNSVASVYTIPVSVAESPVGTAAAKAAAMSFI